MTSTKNILAVGVGNTNLQAAVGEYKRFKTWHMPMKEMSAEHFSDYIEHDFGPEIWNNLEGSVLSTVYPEKTPALIGIIEKKTGKPVKRVDLTNCGGITSAYQGLLGEDRLVCCAGALRVTEPPFIVADFGTAATINVVNKGGAFAGGAIMTGVKTGLLALSEGTAQLPLTELKPDSPVVGVNTAQNLISGAVIGAACALEGYIRRIWNELGYETPIIITGGDAGAVLPHFRLRCRYEPELLIQGLFAVYECMEAVK
ncbi:MAG: type III pantothenate kinase [Clostridiales bacterium]|jgi:type III pantothenate kinase|nr:type III pantothenate kinase [Clostridiales bacterium]